MTDETTNSPLRTSPEIGDLCAALALAQGAMSAAAKDSANPHFKSRYADLASIWAAAQGPLTSNGLCVIQAPGTDGAQVTLTTRLAHKSGQWMESTVSSSAGRGQGPQAVGSTLTYLRRYSLAAMVGVVTDDDDGEGAYDRNPNPRRGATPSRDNRPSSPREAAATPRQGGGGPPPPRVVAPANPEGNSFRGRNDHESWTDEEAARFKAWCFAVCYPGAQASEPHEHEDAYQLVAAFTKSRAKSKPSAWPQDRRTGFVNQASNEGEVRSMLLAHIDTARAKAAQKAGA